MRTADKIVTTCFAPADVQHAIEELVAGPSWEIRRLYTEILNVLEKLENKLKGSVKNVSQIAGILALQEDGSFGDIKEDDVRQAIRELSGSSKGAMVLNEDQIVINTSHEELVRKLVELTGNPGLPFERSNFKRFNPVGK